MANTNTSKIIAFTPYQPASREPIASANGTLCGYVGSYEPATDEFQYNGTEYVNVENTTVGGDVNTISADGESLLIKRLSVGMRFYAIAGGTIAKGDTIGGSGTGTVIQTGVNADKFALALEAAVSTDLFLCEYTGAIVVPGGA